MLPCPSSLSFNGFLALSSEFILTGCSKALSLAMSVSFTGSQLNPGEPGATIGEGDPDRGDDGACRSISSIAASKSNLASSTSQSFGLGEEYSFRVP